MVAMDPDRAVALMAAKQFGLVTRAQALRSGLSPSGCDRRLRDGSFERVHRSVYRLAGAPKTFEQQVKAACLAIPGAVASHRAAATLLGFPEVPARLELMVPRSCLSSLEGVTLWRRAGLDPRDVDRYKAIPITSVVRTLVDLPEVLAPEELAACLDHVLAVLRIPLAYIEERLKAAGARGRVGAGTLGRLIAERRGQPRHHNSRAQRRLERVIAASGFEPVVYEKAIELDDGQIRYADAYFPAHGLIVEVNSYRHHSSLVAWERDNTRSGELVALGLSVLPVTPNEIRDDPEGVADLIGRALARRREGAITMVASRARPAQAETMRRSGAAAR